MQIDNIEKKQSDAQARAKHNWNKKNREKNVMYSAKSMCKKYIRDYADHSELQEVEEWIAKKRETLKSNKK